MKELATVTAGLALIVSAGGLEATQLGRSNVSVMWLLGVIGIVMVTRSGSRYLTRVLPIGPRRARLIGFAAAAIFLALVWYFAADALLSNDTECRDFCGIGTAVGIQVGALAGAIALVLALVPSEPEQPQTRKREHRRKLPRL